eukprot:jgi/Chlat1/3762/Chrsp259S03901
MARGLRQAVLCVALLGCLRAVWADGKSPYLSQLPKNLLVTHEVLDPINPPAPGINATSTGDSSYTPIVKAGEGHISAYWKLNTSDSSLAAGIPSNYDHFSVRLCFGAPSLVNRAWRKRSDYLFKDKQCGTYSIAKNIPFSADGGNLTQYEIENNVGTAIYFIRVYVLDSDNHEVAWGQSVVYNITAPPPAPLLKGQPFQVQSIDSVSGGLIAAAVVFSIAAIAFLAGYFIVDRFMMAKKA